MENISKKKRGRPKSTHAPMRDWLAHEFPSKTDRTQRNMGYMLAARVALRNGDDQRFVYLIDKNKKRTRDVILTELGRLDDPALIEKAALTICSGKMKTAEAVAWLRKIRGSSRKTSEKALRLKLAQCVDEWMLRDGATLDVAVVALRNVLNAVQKMQGGE